MGIVTKVHRTFNFPFFVGIMAFLVPMAWFNENSRLCRDNFVSELVDAWIALRDDDCALIFSLMMILVLWISLSRAMDDLAFEFGQKEVEA